MGKIFEPSSPAGIISPFSSSAAEGIFFKATISNTLVILIDVGNPISFKKSQKVNVIHSIILPRPIALKNFCTFCIHSCIRYLGHSSPKFFNLLLNLSIFLSKLSTKSFGSPPIKSKTLNPAIFKDSNCDIACFLNSSFKSSGADFICASSDSILELIKLSTSSSVNVGSEGKPNADHIVSNLEIRSPNKPWIIPRAPLFN